jgi:hypothetical protein
MIAFPITDLLDDRIWTLWLERYLHPSGLPCPSCGSTAQRLCRAQGHFPASRGRACQGYDILLPGPVCANTRQRPGTLVLLLRGMAKGEPTVRRTRALGLSRTQLPTRRQRIQAHRHATAPTEMMAATAVEAEARYQNAGEKQHPASGAHRPAPSARH